MQGALIMVADIDTLAPKLEHTREDITYNKRLAWQFRRMRSTARLIQEAACNFSRHIYPCLKWFGFKLSIHIFPISKCCIATEAQPRFFGKCGISGKMRVIFGMPVFIVVEGPILASKKRFHIICRKVHFRFPSFSIYAFFVLVRPFFDAWSHSGSIWRISYATKWKMLKTRQFKPQNAIRTMSLPSSTCSARAGTRTCRCPRTRSRTAWERPSGGCCSCARVRGSWWRTSARLPSNDSTRVRRGTRELYCIFSVTEAYSRLPLD